MNALLDENIPPVIARALRELGELAYAIGDDDMPAKGTPDLEIFQWLRDRGPSWCLITRDLRQRKNRQEHQVMRSHQLAVFQVIHRGDLSRLAMAELIITNWSAMKAIIDAPHRPCIYGLTPGRRAPYLVEA
jgi:hypothetical protein